MKNLLIVLSLIMVVMSCSCVTTSSTPESIGRIVAIGYLYDKAGEPTSARKNRVEALKLAYKYSKLAIDIFEQENSTGIDSIIVELIDKNVDNPQQKFIAFAAVKSILTELYLSEDFQNLNKSEQIILFKSFMHGVNNGLEEYGAILDEK